ncbi:hypothetical protein [Methyloceanibacter methanicus]|nr:hypothetical protein [Methyloceanibacter methanicus]
MGSVAPIRSGDTVLAELPGRDVQLVLRRVEGVLFLLLTDHHGCDAFRVAVVSDACAADLIADFFARLAEEGGHG